MAEHSSVSDTDQDSSSESDSSFELFSYSVPGEEKQCCICMRRDTKLLHMCLVNGGGINIFSLLCKLKGDPEDSEEPTLLIICWECDSIMSTVLKFRQMACKAQRRLSSMADGQHTFVLIPSVSAAILEYRAPVRADYEDSLQPLLRIVRFDGTDATLSPQEEVVAQSSLQELLDGIHE